MIRAGLTGGYATGKTLVSAEFAKLGCYVIHADELGHQVLQCDGEAYSPVLALFGQQILGEDKVIDRRKLARLVFDCPERLEKLTALVHPAVFRKEEDLTAVYAAQNPNGILIYEAAILIETGRYKQYDVVILTASDEETQIARGMQRDKSTREDVLSRIRRQLPLQEKQKYADFTIDTSGSQESIVVQVREVYAKLKEMSERR
jgi:dephospho-CoA kinase